MTNGFPGTKLARQQMQAIINARLDALGHGAFMYRRAALPANWQVPTQQIRPGVVFGGSIHVMSGGQVQRYWAGTNIPIPSTTGSMIGDPQRVIIADPVYDPVENPDRDQQPTNVPAEPEKEPVVQP